MRTKTVSFVMAGLAAAGLISMGSMLRAGAQNGADAKSGAAATNKQGSADTRSGDSTAKPKAGPSDTTSADATDQKQDSAEVKRLRSELDDLLNQRAEIDRKIAETRKKLGPNSRTGQNFDFGGGNGQNRTYRFQFQNGNGQPQVFEFNGDANGNFPPEVKKQIEEAQKRMREAFGNMNFDFPMMDFQFDNGFGQDGNFDSKAFRDRMQKLQQNFGDRMQRRFNNGAPGRAPADKDKPAVPGKDSTKKPKTVDV